MAILQQRAKLRTFLDVEVLLEVVKRDGCLLQKPSNRTSRLVVALVRADEIPVEPHLDAGCGQDLGQLAGEATALHNSIWPQRR